MRPRGSWVLLTQAGFSCDSSLWVRSRSAPRAPLPSWPRSSKASSSHDERKEAKLTIKAYFKSLLASYPPTSHSLTQVTWWNPKSKGRKEAFVFHEAIAKIFKNRDQWFNLPQTAYKFYSTEQDTFLLEYTSNKDLSFESILSTGKPWDHDSLSHS